ncbi:hypothetical protein GF357_01350 [Candidatus Dojkabacteria bacterium]|nr:hypothetical protein [Candidatus Dojkabacteria bacterium]
MNSNFQCGRRLFFKFITGIIFAAIFITVSDKSAYAYHWTKLASGGFNDKSEYSIEHYTEYENKIFFSSVIQNNSSSKFRIMSFDGTNFANESDENFGIAGSFWVSGMGVYEDKLYVGIYFQNGYRLWVKDGSNPWALIRNGGTNYMANGFCEVGGNLYIGTNNPAGAQVWEFDGVDWTQVDDGVFASNDRSALNCTVMDSKLYFATENFTDGTAIWELDPSQPSGARWNQLAAGGFGNSNNQKSNLVVYDGKIYAGTYNVATGGEIWVYSQDSGSWDWSNLVDKGNGNQENYYLGVSMVERNSKLYFSTGNLRKGTQIWEYDGSDLVQINLAGFGDVLNNSALVVNYASEPDQLFAFTRNTVYGVEVWETGLSGQTNGPQDDRY